MQQAAHERDVAVVLGMAENDAGTFYNTSLLVTPDGVAMHYRKTHLWPSERDLFQPGDRYTTALWKGVHIGLLICYDIEFPESARALGQLGAELIAVTNGNMDPYGPVHRTAIMARAQENQAFAVMVNRVGPGTATWCSRAAAQQSTRSAACCSSRGATSAARSSSWISHCFRPRAAITTISPTVDCSSQISGSTTPMVAASS